MPGRLAGHIDGRFRTAARGRAQCLGKILKLLLDTHALLWWWTDPKLSLAARQAMADDGNQVLVGAASAQEIAINTWRLGKLPHTAQALDRYNELVTADGFAHLPISYLHSLKAGTYSSEHRDPFDRMLAAQADLEKAVLVTLDTLLRDFSVQGAMVMASMVSVPRCSPEARSFLLPSCASR